MPKDLNIFAQKTSANFGVKKTAIISKYFLWKCLYKYMKNQKMSIQSVLLILLHVTNL